MPLVNCSGRPVWPVVSRDDLRSLSAALGAFGVPAVESRDAMPAVAAPESVEQVVAIHEQCAQAAKLYAHLTSREYGGCFSSIHEIPTALLRGTHVIVCFTRSLTHELVLKVISHTDGLCGLVAAPDCASLLRRVLLSSALAGLSGTSPIRYAEVSPTTPLTPSIEAGRLVVGASSGARLTRLAVGFGAGVLSLNAHSDGVDANLGDELVVCPAFSASEVRDSLDLLPCVRDDVCRRHHLALDQFRSRALEPESIAAGLLIWNACYALLEPRSVDPTWNLLTRLNSNPRIGAIVSSWGVGIYDRSQHEHLADLLEAGLPAGEALRRYNRTDSVRRLRQEMFLLGDPRTLAPRLRSAESRTAVGPSAIQPTVQSKPRTIVPDAVSELCLLRNAFAFEKERAVPEKKGLVCDVLDAIVQRELAASTDAPDGLLLELEDRLRNLVLEYLLGKGRFLGMWCNFASAEASSASIETCTRCGNVARKTSATLRLHVQAHRELLVCALCGEVVDRPAALPWTIDISGDGRCALSRNFPSERILVRTLRWSQSPRYGDRQDWPVDSSGQFERRFEIPLRREAGETVTVFVMHGLGVSLFGRRIFRKAPEVAELESL